MKKIDAIIKGRKFTEKLFGIKKRSINRALDSAKDNFEEQKENAQVEYENLLLKLTDDNPDYKVIINNMIDKQQIIQDANNSIDLIDKIKFDLEAEVEDDEVEDEK